jgi:hypothetical protein
MKKNNKYIYVVTKTKEEFLSYTDIANEFGMTKGMVAGKFYRATKKGKNSIFLNGKEIQRTKIVLPPKPVVYKRWSKNNVTFAPKAFSRKVLENY